MTARKIKHKQIIEPADHSWQLSANCIGMDPALFFADRVAPREAQQACAGCPVSEQCLEYALVNRIDAGYWGGRSERERRRILKQRREQGVA